MGGVPLPRGGGFARATSSRTLRWLLLLAGIGIVAILVLDRSSNHGTPTPTTVASPIPAGQGSRVYSFVQTQPDQRLFDGTVTFGAPTRVGQGSAEDVALSAGGCALDPKTDAVVPAYLVLTNRSQGVDATAAAAFEWQPGTIAGLGISTPSGLTCTRTDGTSLASTRSRGPLPPGKAATAALFVIVSGYYSPAHPHGDPAVLARVHLALAPTTAPDGETVTPGRLRGPSPGTADGAAGGAAGAAAGPTLSLADTAVASLSGAGDPAAR